MPVINARVSTPSQYRVSGTTTFVGSSNISLEANLALQTAQTALATANTKYNQSGGLIGGSIIPSSANSYNLGSNTAPFHSLYVGPGTVYIDNIALSNSQGQLLVSNELAMNVAGDIISSGNIYGTIDGGTFS